MWDGDGAVGYAFAKVTAHPAHPGIEGTILVEGTAAQYLPLTVGAPALETRTDISELFWDFGDGTSAQGPEAVHTYAERGTYTVVLTATFADGTTASDSVEVVVAENMPPVASVEVEGDGATRSFDASASYDPEGAPLTYAWDFGDGNRGEGAQPSHTYESPGTYTAVLTISDGTHTSTAFTTVAVGTDHRNILLYLIPLAAVVGGLALYMRRYGPKNTFEGVDLVKKGE